MNAFKQPQPTSKFPLNVISLNDFVQMQLPPRELILAPWLTTQGLAMIHAPRGIGKTHMSLGIGCAVASGTEFLKWSAPNPKGVLLIDGEMQGNELQKRFQRILKNLQSPLPAPFKLVTPDLQSQGIPDLSSIEGQTAINEYIADDIDLIIVDNLSTCARSGKENEAESWLPVQNWALQLRASGKSVLFIHHSGKSGAQRGTSRREDVLDTVIALKHPSEYSPDQGACFEVHFEKSRSNHGADVRPFQATLQSNNDNEHQWNVTPVAGDSSEEIIRMRQQGKSQTEIANVLGVNKSTVNRKVRLLEQQGRLL